MPLHLDIQLKCTSVPKYEKDGFLHFEIDRKLFEGLNCKRKSTPWLLFILILPQNVEHWVSVEDKELIARETMLWYDATDDANDGNGEKVSLKVPLSNKVNKDSLYHLITKQMEVEE